MMVLLAAMIITGRTPTFCRRAMDNAGATTTDSEYTRVKYPIPSAKRFWGIISAATVEVAVDPSPHPIPWSRRNAKIMPNTEFQPYLMGDFP